MSDSAPGRSRVRYVPTLVLLVIAAIDLLVGSQYKADARVMPMLVGALILVLLTLDLLSLGDGPIGARLTQLLSPERDAPLTAHSIVRQAQALAWVGGFTAALLFAGIIAGVFIYVAGSMRFFGRRSWARSLLTALLVTIFIWGLFTTALRIPLYPGWAMQQLLAQATL